MAEQKGWKWFVKSALIQVAFCWVIGGLFAVLGSPEVALALFVLPCMIYLPLAAVLLALRIAFRIRVRNGYVEHVFLGRFLIQRRRLTRFVYIDHDNEEVIFEGGKTLRIMGSQSAAELNRMDEELLARSLEAKAAEKAGCDNPPHAVVIAPEWLSWQEGTVAKLAHIRG